MRYEFDHRTGGMVPKKDDTIYFAQSQGGGLIVDDKKNNLRYIIERDGRITKLFGSFRGNGLNIYDMRDARMIAERVMRLLGRDHKYSDYHYFLRGYHMNESYIKSCSDYMNESIWSDMQDRGDVESVKPEDGEIIGQLPDGTNLVLSREALNGGELVEFDDDQKYYNLYEDIYICIIYNNKDYTDTYYRYDEDAEGVVNMTEMFSADDSLRTENEFGALKAMILEADWYGTGDLDGMTVEAFSNRFDFQNGREEYMLFTDHDAARDYALDSNKDLLEGNIDQESLKRWYNYFGEKIFNVNGIEDMLKEYYDSYFDDLVYDDEIIDKLLEMEIISKTDEYFEVDEDGDVDTDVPKFDPEDYRSEFVDKSMENINDVVDHCISEFGFEDLENYVDIDKLAEEITDYDGIGKVISSYDGKEREQTVGDVTYYIYRTN